MIFRNAYIMGGWSAAVCLPSRTMIMTGRTLWHVPGLSGNTYPANIADKTIPVAFNNAGYDTIRSGKKGNSYLEANVRFGQYMYHDVRDNIASSRFVDDALGFIASRQGQGRANPFLIYLGFDHPHDPRPAAHLVASGKTHPPLSKQPASSFIMAVSRRMTGRPVHPGLSSPIRQERSPCIPLPKHPCRPQRRGPGTPPAARHARRGGAGRA
jgi:hypothetical protein